ncbi:MAG: hypothetical protein J6J60_00365 [Clostridia bacterium]|nr:hypothetical protein [Clostridia bacterium]
MKKRSKIIKDLIMDNINVLQAMQSVALMLEDIDDKEIKNWVKNEINGYQKDDDIPNYRKANTMLIGNIQVGYAIYNHINIPLSDSKAIEAFTKLEIRDPISTIIQMSKAESESETHSLMLEANIALVNHYQQTNGDVISAHRKLSIYAYTNILGMIKDKLLEIFKVLEKNYGNLDELYIDFSDSSKKDEIVKELVAIVYNDNSIKIGNNNQFKDSVVGDENGN